MDIPRNSGQELSRNKEVYHMSVDIRKIPQGGYHILGLNCTCNHNKISLAVVGCLTEIKNQGIVVKKRICTEELLCQGDINSGQGYMGHHHHPFPNNPSIYDE